MTEDEFHAALAAHLRAKATPITDTSMRAGLASFHAGQTARVDARIADEIARLTGSGYVPRDLSIYAVPVSAPPPPPPEAPAPVARSPGDYFAHDGILFSPPKAAP
jgi:hypothetical protein